MAIIGTRTLANIRCRGRAISPRAAIRVDGAIACNVTNVRSAVCGRATAQARCLRSTIRVGKAFVVVTPVGPDDALIRVAATVHSGPALAVGRACCSVLDRAHRAQGRRAGWVGLAGRSTALRGAARSRGPVVERNPRGGRSHAPRNREQREFDKCPHSRTRWCA
jgi:hypothetical protein